ncbi:phage tail tube protein [Microbacterium sp. MMO-10]|uniref:phage tail tube protein n=1 Tax=Microbacterium sp. MMO-10 TaxID=3081272 RepID=UPI0030165648
MPLEATQNGVAADGNGRVLWVPAIADPGNPKLSELTAAGVKPLTYGLTADGFNHTITENAITTGRYTLAQIIELAGTVQDALELKYVYNRTSPTPTETALGTAGTAGFVVHQLGYPNATALAAAQKINAVIPCKTGIARDNPPTANSELSKSVKMYVTDTVRREVTIAAG